MKLRFWKCAIAAYVLFFSYSINSYGQNCSGGLDTIDQVSVFVACKDSFTIMWPTHASNCYTVTVGTGINGVQANGSLTISKNAAGISDFSKITITESCGGLISDPCTNTTASDIFMGVVPPLDSAGLWTFEKLGMTGSGTMMTGSGTAAFTSISPTNVPDVSADANVSATTTSIIRPTCTGYDDGSFEIQVSFIANTLDSLKHETRRVDNSAIVQPFGSALNINNTQTTQLVDVTGTIAAGLFETKIIFYSGVCVDSITHMTTVGDGSNEPVVACNSDLNLAVDAECMVDIHIGMILAGQSSPCIMNLMDSLVVKLGDGTVVPTINVGSGSYDTIRIQDASNLIMVPLIIEVHSDSSGISNSCWGNLLLEDKRAPVLFCDTSYVVRCFDFDATDMSNVITMDCDTAPTINLINQNTITDCNLLPAFPNDSIVKRVIRTFNAVDNYNNVSNTCTDTIDIRRLDADLSNNTMSGGVLDIPGLKYPLDYLVNNNPLMPNDTTAFVCDDSMPFADENNDGIPDPVDFIITSGGDTLYGAGVPSIDTIIGGDTLFVQFFPSNVNNPHPSVATMFETCKAVTTFRDVILPPIGCVRKVVRTWTISEWVCNRETTREINQTIEIQDTLGPNITVPVNMKVTTNQNDCSRRMQIPPLSSVSDQCSFNGQPTKILVRVINNGVVGALSTDDNTYDPNTGGILLIPQGIDTVIYTAFDDCHNSTSDTTFIEVVDETAPVMICKEFVTVGLSSNTGVQLPAQSVDNGSFDDCSMEGMCVVRMVDINRFDELRSLNIGGVLSNGFDYVPLDSMVGACGRIFTASGTLNGLEYIIKDDLCTPHAEYCCNDGGTQDTVILRGFDKKGNVNQCMAQVDVQDKRSPFLHCPPDITVNCEFGFATDSIYSIFGNLVQEGFQEAIDLPVDAVLGIEEGKSLVDGVWSGNCTGEISVRAEREADKCSVGTINRTFSLSFNGSTTSCVQRITISRSEKIDIKDIVFPPDTTFHACGSPTDIDPDVTGRPFTSEDGCSLLGDAYSDIVVRKNNGSGDACLSIIRKWTIIDWCEEPSKIIGTKSQVISLIDTISPILVNGSCSDTIIRVENCDNAIVSLSQRASDGCTEPQNLIWSVDIDEDNDGTIENNLSVTPIEDNNESLATLNTSLPHGVHRLVWNINDQCGNIQSCEQIVTILNENAPAAICRSSITGPLSPLEGGGASIVVWADEYNIGSSSHECDYDVIYSFSPVGIVDSRTLTCADFNPVPGADSSVVEMMVYTLTILETNSGTIKDTVFVSSAVCNVEFVLYDSHNACINAVLNNPEFPSSDLVTIDGSIKTESGKNIATVNVDLQNLDPNSLTLGTETDQDGVYAFPSMDKGDSYVLKPRMNTDILNGVSTLDLVLIQKHILGLEGLDSPYKVIAADINNDKTISAIDMIELRKVILNVSDQFTNNTSWRFIDESYEFSSRRDPLKENYPESSKILVLENDMSINFIGIKTGDVNETVDVSNLTTNSRSKGKLILMDQEFVPGELVQVPVKISGSNSIVGFQYALKFDPKIIEFAGYRSEALDLSAENFGLTNLANGILYSSWNNHKGFKIDQNEVFVLEFRARTSSKLSDVISLDRSHMKSELYSDLLAPVSLELMFKEGKHINYGQFELFQNTPNPFSENTEISFVIPERGEVALKLYDVNGVLLREFNQDFDSGFNKISISKKDLGISSGVVIYTLESGSFKATKEMIVVD